MPRVTRYKSSSTNPGGILGANWGVAGLQMRQGAPAPHSHPREFHGLSGWFSQTHPSSPQTGHLSLMVSPFMMLEIGRYSDCNWSLGG